MTSLSQKRVLWGSFWFFRSGSSGKIVKSPPNLRVGDVGSIKTSAETKYIMMMYAAPALRKVHYRSLTAGQEVDVQEWETNGPPTRRPHATDHVQDETEKDSTLHVAIELGRRLGHVRMVPPSDAHCPSRRIQVETKVNDQAATQKAAPATSAGT